MVPPMGRKVQTLLNLITRKSYLPHKIGACRTSNSKNPAPTCSAKFPLPGLKSTTGWRATRRASLEPAAKPGTSTIGTSSRKSEGTSRLPTCQPMPSRSVQGPRLSQAKKPAWLAPAPPPSLSTLTAASIPATRLSCRMVRPICVEASQMSFHHPAFQQPAIGEEQGMPAFVTTDNCSRRHT